MANEPIDRAPAAAVRSPEPTAERAGAGIDGVAGLVARLREHKIAQWALAYIGAAITVAHGEDLAAHAFGWNEAIARWLIALLIVGFPIILTLAWYQGHKGLTRITQGELMLCSILFVIGAGILVVLVRPPPEAAGQTGAAAKPEPQARVEMTSATAAVPAPASLKPRIAVLPFENLSPDPRNAFFADGVHEEILTELANHAPGLAVISGTTMSTYRGKAVTVETLARDLNCTYVLEGSLQREGDEVRLTLQLIDARSDSHVWAQDYNRKLVSAMALESEVAAAVTEQLSLKFAGAVQSGGSTSSPLAYDLYLKARAAEGSATDEGTMAGYRQAEQLLDQAIATDPNFARAYLERMSVGVRQFLYNFAPPDQVLPRARADLAAAQHLAPTDPVVIAFEAVMAYAELDYGRALQLFETAEAAGLADPELLDWHNKLLFAMGSYPEAVALSRRLADLDPKNEAAQYWWWYMLMELHRYPEALRLADIGIVRAQIEVPWRIRRANVLFYAGGDLKPLSALSAPFFRQPWRTEQDVQSLFSFASYELSLEHRFGDLRKLIDTAQSGEVRSTYHMWPLYRVGRTPLADERGWMDLLLGDRGEARRP